MSDRITVVSGLPRSGTSMMMAMLEAGGIPLVTDGERTADEDNPKGYFELERVKQLDRDPSWLSACEGRAVKIISRLLSALPSAHRYDVVFMRRSIDEILTSQKKMLARRGERDETSDAEMKSMFYAHLDEVMAWLDAQPNFRVKYASYNRLLESPDQELAKLASFLGARFEATKAKPIIDAALYRNRG